MERLQIKEPKSTDKKLSFSFEFYDIGTSGARSASSFCLRDFDETQIAGSLVRLKELGAKTWNDLAKQAKGYHFHPVDWTKTTQKRYPSNAVMQIPQFQFSLVGVNNGKARVFGSYSEGIFYVVWFDLEHKIWPSFKKNT